MKSFLIFLLLIPLLSISQKKRKEPTWEEIRVVENLAPQYWITVFLGFNNEYDTTKYYLKILKEEDKKFSRNKSFLVVKEEWCFQYWVNPTWDGDNHFIICDCAPLDSAMNREYYKYWHNKKYRDSLEADLIRRIKNLKIENNVDKLH